MNYLITGLIAVATFVGGIFAHAPANYQSLYDAGTDSHIFGSISFPSSLDSLTNPASTDSVATVSHSAQHSNANDAIEAIEAKVGIGASTPTNNTIFVGNGTGSSGYSASATSTNFLATNFTSASSTMASTSITTLLTVKATTTDLYVGSLASTTQFRANSATIGNSTIGTLTVTSCSGCSVASTPTTWYVATSTTNRAYYKQLALVSGDMVIWSCYTTTANQTFNPIAYRVLTPWLDSTTTVSTAGAAFQRNIFLATTTETVNFSCTATAAENNNMVIQVQNVGYSNAF